MADTTIIAEDSAENWVGDIKQLEKLRSELSLFLHPHHCRYVPRDEDFVTILSTGEDKFALIRLIRDLAKLPLSQAKEFLDEPFPRRLKLDGVYIDSAIFRLESAGAVVEHFSEDQQHTFMLDRRMFDAIPEIQLSPDADLWARVQVNRHGARGSITVLSKQQLLSAQYILSTSSFHSPLRFHYGNYFEGDESPESYLKMSILLRELEEVGADWHGIAWGSHQLLDKAPAEQWQYDSLWRRTLKSLGSPAARSFEEADLRPRVRMQANGQAYVDFFMKCVSG